MMKQQKTKLLNFIPLLADGLTLLLLGLLLPTAVTLLQTPSAINVIFLVSAYGLMCLGLYLIRRLEPSLGSRVESPPQRARTLWLGLGVLFGACVMTAMAFQFNYFAAIFEVDTLALGEGESATFFVFAPGAWLGTSLLYAAFLALPLTAKVAETDGRYPWQALIGLLGLNSMFLFVVAQTKALLVLFGGFNFALSFVLGFVLLLLLFGPPRLLYWHKQPGLASLSFLLLAAVAAWAIAV
jgi:hypothetical protein